VSKIEILSYGPFVKFQSIKLSGACKTIYKKGIESVNLQVSILI
jgi:hypothetical protein